MTTNFPFPDGKLPPMPTIEIDELTAKEISQEKVDQSLQMLWDERPDLVIALMQAELQPEAIWETDEFQDKLDDIGRYLRMVAAPRLGGFNNPSSSTQTMWEMRKRVRRVLGLPITKDEIEAARMRGEKV